MQKEGDTSLQYQLHVEVHVDVVVLVDRSWQHATIVVLEVYPQVEDAGYLEVEFSHITQVIVREVVATWLVEERVG